MKKKHKIFEGYLHLKRKSQPVLWEIPFDRNREHYKFPRRFIQRYNLINGVRIKCEIEGYKIKDVLRICGNKPEDYEYITEFRNLIPVNPTEKFEFGNSNEIALRILDLTSPIAKGTRGLIVSPPRAGKTMLLEAIANEIPKIDPKLRVIVLLIDERPEEITSFKMNTKAEIFHSSLDQGSSSHVLLSSFLIDHIKVELESGNDMILLIDSLTRMGRAYNIKDNNAQNRIMSGGISSGALELPRKLFGLARNIEKSGSCTILATILKDTGSRMDEVIFQEFKGTGNCEIILDREIAQQRVFPAINILESGTRKEELLRPLAHLNKINFIRSRLLQLNKTAAIEELQEIIKRYKTNNELIEHLK